MRAIYADIMLYYLTWREKGRPMHGICFEYLALIKRAYSLKLYPVLNYIFALVHYSLMGMPLRSLQLIVVTSVEIFMTLTWPRTEVLFCEWK